MFEVMTLVTCDGPPGGRGWARQTTQGRRQLWRWFYTSAAPGSTTKNPADSLPRGPVSTALTSTIQPPKHPAEIVGILRFVLGVQRRCACDVSTMDTSDLPALFPPRIAVFRTTSLPRTPVRTSVSEVMTLRCLRSEETAHDMPLTRVVASGAARPAHARLAKRSRRAASPPTTSTSSAETRVSGVAYSKGSPGLMRPKTVIP